MNTAFLRAALMLGCAGLAYPALAEPAASTTEAATADAAADDASEAGPNIVVTGDVLYSNRMNALKTPTPIIDVPQSLSITTADQIIRQGFDSVGDIVNYTPGVTNSQGEGHRDAVVFRGVRSTADFFVDGGDLEPVKAALSELAKVGFDPVFGARPLKRAIQQRIENPLSKLLLEGKFAPKDVVPVDVDPIRSPGEFHFGRVVH